VDYGSLSVSAFMYARERFRQKLREPVTHDVDDDCLAQSFSFDGLMRMPVVVASIMLRLYW
jgi:hypothetical protein